ncbi:MAG: hypothetical protein OXC18_15450 [Desulfurellaceae bacterium]|nr:hypothetical protein [Desulfurellaceae bacterium]
MASQPNIHKKMDKILQKLATLEANDKGLTKQTNYLAQLVVLAKQDSARHHQESQAMLHDMGQMLLEVRKSSARTEERVAEILAETRRGVA